MSGLEKVLDVITLICFLAMIAIGVLGYAAGN